MPHSLVGKKHGGDPSDGSSGQKLQRSKMGRIEDADKRHGTFLKLDQATQGCGDQHFSSIWDHLLLAWKKGKLSHKWTVYVRGANNEDLSVAVKRVVFQLHSSFNNPTRIVESAPFELSESGWGEFEIAITLFFHNDVSDKQLDLYHHLKLYPDDESGPQSPKKPVVVESYDEIVFLEPSEAFVARVCNHPAVAVTKLPSSINLPALTGPTEKSNEKKKGDTKDHPLSQWFLNFSEADELTKLASERQQVQLHVIKLKKQLSALEASQNR